MFLEKNGHRQILKNNENIARIIIGCGALGLFIASKIADEFEIGNLYFINKSLLDKPIYIANNYSKKIPINFTNFFLISEISKNFPNIYKNNIIFYICLPPDQINESIQYLSAIKEKCKLEQNFTVVFMNNGIINYELFKKIFREKSITFIRCIVIAGFMRYLNEDHILIKNTSGKEIFYGYFSKPNIKSQYIFPKLYLNWSYTRNIFRLEKAKFITNFILGFFIKNKLRKNKEIFNILLPKQLDEIFSNYCKIFPKSQISSKYVKFYFYKTIKLTSENVNSISFAWHNGNEKPMAYFLAKIEELTYLSSNIMVQEFFKKLIDLNRTKN